MLTYLSEFEVCFSIKVWSFYVTHCLGFTVEIKYITVKDDSDSVRKNKHCRHIIGYSFWLGQVRSGQVRVFNENIQMEMFYLMTHSTHFIYGYMASDIW